MSGQLVVSRTAAVSSCCIIIHYIRDTEKLDENVKQTWREYDAATITRARQTKTLVLHEMVKVREGNSYKLPHASPAARARLFE